MATDSGYEKGNYLRVCDICGHRFHFRDLKPIGELRFACPDDAPGLTSMQVSRFNARAKPLIVRPNKWAKDYSQTGIYQLAEAQIFNFVSQVAPKGERDGSNDPRPAAWATIYLADIISQEKRSLEWTRTATTAIQRCLTYLATRQAGTGLVPQAPVTDPWYGGITADVDPFVGTEFSATLWSTPLTIAAGLAWLKAYTALGTRSYLDNARKCATFIRHVQCADLQVTAYTVFPSGGGRYHIGGLAEKMHDFTGLTTATYNLADVAGAWFLALLAAVDDGRSYGEASSPGYYMAPTTATLATMTAELTAFAEVGARDATTSLVVCPLSTTAPKTTYSAALNGAGGPAAWATTSPIVTNDIALGVLGVYQANGNTAKVTETMAWLAAFGSNANNYTPATLTPEEVFQGITGTYDPTLCPADILVNAAPFTEADGALYGWASLGVLSPILAGNQAAFRRSKDQISTSVRYTTLDVTNKWLGPIGSSGLSLQPFARDSLGNIIGAGGLPAPSASVSPPSEGLVFWVRGDTGLESSGGLATAWRDRSGFGQDITDLPANPGPATGSTTIDGIPAVRYPLGNGPGSGLYRTTGLRDRNGVAFGYGPGQTQSRTVVAVIRPRFSPTGFNITGGVVCDMVGTPSFQPLFNLEDNFVANSFYCFSTAWRDPEGGALKGPYTAGGVSGPYNGTTVIGEWSSTGFNQIAFRINNVVQALTPSVIPGVPVLGANVFALGRVISGGLNFFGDISEVLIYDWVLDTPTRQQLMAYLATNHPANFPQHPTSSVERAAQTGLLYRQNPGRYPFLRGN